MRIRKLYCIYVSTNQASLAMKKIIFSFLLSATAILSSNALEPVKGYRGFFELSNSLTSYPTYDMANEKFGRDYYWYTGFSTSHGYQFNPHFFLGAGVSVEGYYEDGGLALLVPIFLQVRTDQTWGKFTPYGDLRVGYNVHTAPTGYFVSPSVGYRFNWGRKMNANVGIGLSYMTQNCDIWQIVYDEVDGYQPYHYGKETLSKFYFTLRFGIDF